MTSEDRLDRIEAILAESVRQSAIDRAESSELTSWWLRTSNPTPG